MSSPVFLAIAGSIGSGKTTLTRRLVERLGLVGLYEDTADNPYLEDFYASMPRYALPLQLRFLAHRVAMTRHAQAAGRGAVQDRTCYEDAEIFAKTLHNQGEMDDRDWETYCLVARQLLEGIEPPDLLVYLRRSPRSCAENIARRGRAYEQAIEPDYLTSLGRAYDDWIDQYNRGAHLVVDADQHDFLHSTADLYALVSRIAAALPQRLLFV